MRKTFFAREAMLAGSPLRIIMGLETEDSKKLNQIERKGQTVTFRYSIRDEIYLEEDFTEFFESMKQVYGEEVKGDLTIAIVATDDYVMDYVNLHVSL